MNSVAALHASKVRGKPSQHNGSMLTARVAAVRLEELACMLVLAFYAVSGYLAGISPHQPTEMTNAPVTRLTFVAGIGSQVIVNAMVCLLVAARWHLLTRSLATIRHPILLQLLALFSLYVAASAAWSQDPALSFRRAVPFCMAALFGVFLSVRFSVPRQLALFTTVMLMLALLSAAVALFFPAVGLDASAGHAADWQGVFTQKNACGRAMVFASAAALALEARVMRKLALLSVFTAVLVMSGSRAAWLLDAAVLVAALACTAVRRTALRSRPAVLGLFAAAGAAMALSAGGNLPALVMLFGRDATLSGRTAIWEEVWHAIVKHPWLGYGFSAFWQGLHGESFQVIVALQFVLVHAHNGFLEVWLELGAAGLVLFLLCYLGALRLCLRQLSRGESGLWPALCLMLTLLYNLDESSLLIFNGIYWVLFVSVAAALARQQLQTAPPISRAALPLRDWNLCTRRP